MKKDATIKINKKPSIFCIMPAYNESAGIGNVINEAAGHVDAVVVVDDGSTDRTAAAATAAGAVVLRHPINRGQGAALETGNQYVRGRGGGIVVHYDADGQFPATEISRILEPIMHGSADIVFGSRLGAADNNSIPPIKKHIVFPLARLFNKLFYRARLRDPQSGLRAMNGHALDKIRSINDGSAHCTEIIAAAHRAKLRITEVPIRVTYEHYGQGFLSGRGRGTGGIKIIRDLLLNKILE